MRKYENLKPEDILLVVGMLLIACTTLDINKHLGMYVLAAEFIATAVLMAYGRSRK